MSCLKEMFEDNKYAKGSQWSTKWSTSIHLHRKEKENGKSIMISLKADNNAQNLDQCRIEIRQYTGVESTPFGVSLTLSELEWFTSTIDQLFEDFKEDTKVLRSGKRKLSIDSLYTKTKTPYLRITETNEITQKDYKISIMKNHVEQLQNVLHFITRLIMMRDYEADLEIEENKRKFVHHVAAALLTETVDLSQANVENTYRFVNDEIFNLRLNTCLFFFGFGNDANVKPFDQEEVRHILDLATIDNFLCHNFTDIMFLIFQSAQFAVLDINKV